jgi:hypothetical protein
LGAINSVGVASITSRAFSYTVGGVPRTATSSITSSRAGFTHSISDNISGRAGAASERSVGRSSARYTVADAAAVTGFICSRLGAIVRLAFTARNTIVVIQRASQAERRAGGACGVCLTVLRLTLGTGAVSVTVLAAISTSGAGIAAEIVAHVRLAIRALGSGSGVHLSRALRAGTGTAETFGSILGIVICVIKDDIVVVAVVADALALTIIRALLTFRWAGLAALVRGLEVISLEVEAGVAVALGALGGAVSLNAAGLAVRGARNARFGILCQVLGVSQSHTLVTDDDIVILVAFKATLSAFHAGAILQVKAGSAFGASRHVQGVGRALLAAVRAIETLGPVLRNDSGVWAVLTQWAGVSACQTVFNVSAALC